MIMLLAAAALGPAALAQKVVPGEVLVKFHQDRHVDEAAVHGKGHARKMGELPGIGTQRLKLDPRTTVTQALAYYRSLPQVEYAEPNFVADAHFVPTDAHFSSQWALRKIQAPASWDIVQGINTVKIAIVDSGVDMDHPDLASKIVGGWDFVNNDAYPDDDNGHGTHTAGIAAAATNNGVGVAGLGFKSTILAVKALDANGSGAYSWIANGIRYAADNGAKVISLSLGGSAHSYTLQDAVNYAVSKGAIVVGSAGNSGTTAANYPAFYSNVIAVGASDSNDQRAYFSNYGSWVDVAAPGTGILSTVRGGGYANMSGTSMAAPYVAGQAALLWSYYGTATSAATIRQRIEANADPIGSWVAFGRINVLRSIGAVISPPPTTGTTTEFAPSALVLTWATLSGGSVGSLTASDNSSAVLSSRLANTRHVVDWYAEGVTTAKATGVSLTVVLEASQTQNLTAYGSIYNWQTARWDGLGTINLTAGDAVARWTKTDPTPYLAMDGKIRIRLWTGNSSTAGFQQQIDQVKFTLTPK